MELKKRTDAAEWVAAYVAEKPLLAESVYLGPKYKHPRGQQEVTDLLLVHHNRALVIQIKCQEDPERRQDNKLLRWVGANARAAAKQLSGTIRSLRERNYWCDHPTLGRVEFAKRALFPLHGIVLVEHRSPELQLPPELPLKIRDVPVSYFTLRDFLETIRTLKTFRDIVDYL